MRPELHLWPGKCRQDCARRPGVITEIEVIGLRHVEIDGHLQRSKSEDTGIEVHITLRVTDDRRHVMDPGNLERHVPTSKRLR